MKEDSTLDTTVDEWRTVMEAEFSNCRPILGLPTIENGRTNIELSKEFSLSRTCMLERLNELIESESCRKGKAIREKRDGSSGWTVVYELIPKTKKRENQ